MFFLAAKALSFLPFGGLLRGFTGKLVLFGVLAAVIAFAVWKWKDSIREQALSAVFAEQAQEQLKQQQQEFERMRRVQELSSEIQTRASEQQRRLQQQLDEAQRQIRGVTTEEDGSVAPVLIMTLDNIRRFEGYQERTVPQVLNENERPNVSGSGNPAIDAFRRRFGGTQ
jgi:flagellar biosynthesis component FlhA